MIALGTSKLEFTRRYIVASTIGEKIFRIPKYVHSTEFEKTLGRILGQFKKVRFLELLVISFFDHIDCPVEDPTTIGTVERA